MSLAPPPIPEGFLSRWCDTLSESSESPPGAFLPTGLALLSAIAGPRLVMRWSPTHEERMNLWILNVGMSALARKTSGLSGLRAAVKWIKDDDDLVRLTSMGRLSDAGLVSTLDVVTSDTARAAKDAEDFPTGPKNKDAERPEVHRDVPLSWITVFNEVSPIWMEDGPGWAMSAQQVMLAVYDGQLSSTTKATHVPSQECFVTAIGNIPPGVLREQTTLGMLSSGFVGRWLVVPTPNPTQIISFPMPNGTDPLNRLRGEIEDLHALAKLGQRYEVNHLWTADAKYLREEWYTAHVKAFTGSSPDDAIAVAGSELFGRLQATAIKVATLLAVGRMSDRLGSLADLRVTVDDVAWANQVIDASIDYVTATLRESGAESSSPGGKTEGRILRYLERVGATSRDSARVMRDVSNAAKGGKVSHRDVVAAVDALYAGEQIHIEEVGNTRQSAGNARRVWLA